MNPEPHHVISNNNNNSTYIARYDTVFVENHPGRVDCLHTASEALRHVDHQDTAIAGLFENLEEIFPSGREVPRTIGSNNSTYIFTKEGAKL